MIDISNHVANRILELLDQSKEIIPFEMGPLVSSLRLQITQRKCDEGLLIDIITLLQDYYTPSSSKTNDSNPLKKDEKQEEKKKNADLIIALHQIRECEIQSYSLKKRR